MRRTLGAPVLGFTILTFAATTAWLVQPRKNSGPDAEEKSDIQSAQVDGSSYFYLESDDPSASLLNNEDTEPRGNWFFESQNSTGVSEGLAQQFPELLPDFVFIGDQNAAREQFLINKGHHFQRATHHYKTVIRQRGNVNGEIRIIASVTVGIDAEFTMAEACAWGKATGFSYGGGMGPKAEVMIQELWRIDANREAPALLERIISGVHDNMLWGFNNFRITTESPPEPVAQFDL